MTSRKDYLLDKASCNNLSSVLTDCHRVIRIVLVVLLFAMPCTVVIGANDVSTGSYAAGKRDLNHGNYNKALKEMLGYIHQEEDKAGEKKDYQTLMHAYMSAGSIFNLFSDFNSAVSYYSKCIELSKSQHNEIILFKVYTNLVGIYCDTQKPRKAEQYNEQIKGLSGMNR